MLSETLLCLLTAAHSPDPAAPDAPDVIPLGCRYVIAEQEVQIDALRDHCCVQYKIKAGDTLVKIASTQLGDARRYPEIQALNPGADPRRLQLHDCIWLPPRHAEHPYQFVYLNTWPGSDFDSTPYVMGERLVARYGGLALLIVDASERDKVAKSREWDEIVALQDAKKLQVLSGNPASGYYENDSSIDRITETFEVVRDDKGRFHLEHDVRYFDALGRPIQPAAANAEEREEDGSQVWLLLLSLGGAGLIALRIYRRAAPAQVGIA